MPELPDEPRFFQALRVVFARAAARPVRTLGYALVATALAVGLRSQLPPTYVATVTFRMAEGHLLEAGSAPRPPARIREYISNVAFSRERLRALMDRHGLFPGLRDSNPEAAVAKLRQWLEIEVVRNYFLLDRREVGEPRTALVVITFSDVDRDRAAAVIHDVGEILAEHARGGRLDLIGNAKASAEREAVAARDLVRTLRARNAALADRAAWRDPATSAAALVESDGELTAALRRLELLERRAAALELSRLAELSMLGLRFERVDERVRAGREPLTSGRAALLGLSAFALLAPLLAALLGAFDRHVYRAADVTAAGFPLLGDLSLLPAGSRTSGDAP